MTNLLFEHQSSDGRYRVWVTPTNDGRYQWYAATPQAKVQAGTAFSTLEEATRTAMMFFHDHRMPTGHNERPNYYITRMFFDGQCRVLAFYRRADGVIDVRVHTVHVTSHSFRRLRNALRNGIASGSVCRVISDAHESTFSFRRTSGEIGG
jgi:hypothetical protein